MGLLLTVTAILGAGACSDEADPQPATAEINAYFGEVTVILGEAYARIEQIVRIFDDEGYAEGLSVNGRRFQMGADALREVAIPAGFEDEHAAYVKALDAIADQLARSAQRIDSGEEVTEGIVSTVADSFDERDDACRQLARQAEEFGAYDVPPCGGDPYFIQAAEPSWSHRVYVNRCCGGSDPLSNPLDIFYGSDEPWERTAEHYEREMAKRGFGSSRRGQELVFSRPDRPEECLSIEEFQAENLPFAVEESEVADLARYPHAYVTGYTLICGG